MYPSSKIGQFMTLRANGWSLDKIAKQINVSKSTLWGWDVKHQNEVHLLKHMQLERVQEQYLPSYEDELKSVYTQLNRIEEALAKHDLSTMTPAFLMQMSLQYRDRLSKMRHQAPLRTVQMGPVEPLPVTGCVTNDSEYPWVDGDPAVEAAEDAAETSEKAAAAAPAQAPAPNHNPPPPKSEGRVTTSPKPIVQVPPLPASNHANGNGKHHHNGHTNGANNGNGKPEHNGHVNGAPNRNDNPNAASDSTIQRFNDSTASAHDSTVQRFNDSTPPTRSVVVPNPENKTEQNRTKREGGLKNGPSASTTSENQN